MDGKILFLGVCIFILVLAWLGAGVLWRAAEVAEIVAPIDEARFDGLTLLTVGTGTEYENPERSGPATAVGLEDTVILVDAGRGVAEALRGARIPLDQPRLVVLTNLLPVNTIGLDDLLYTGWLVPREAPIQVWGPPGTRALIEALEDAHAAGSAALGESLALPKEGAKVAVREIEDGLREEFGGITLEARALPDGPLPALAWAFSADARRVVVSGTGWGAGALTEFADAADALVHEAVYLPTVAELEGTGAEVEHPERIEREAAFHTSIQDVGDIARRAGIGRLVLVRLRPPPFFDLQIKSIVANDYEGMIVVPVDGEVVFP